MDCWGGVSTSTAMPTISAFDVTVQCNKLGVIPYVAALIQKGSTERVEARMGNLGRIQRYFVSIWGSN